MLGDPWHLGPRSSLSVGLCCPNDFGQHPDLVGCRDMEQVRKWFYVDEGFLEQV